MSESGPEFPFLQSRELVMIGLGMLGDNPPNVLQPKLEDGIYLRWAYRKGFPWYGFYLYRRDHRFHRKPFCLSSALQGRGPGMLPRTELQTSFGTVSSSTNLLLTDDFPPFLPSTDGRVEFDLNNRRNLRFSLRDDQTARRVQVKVGFRESAQITVTAFLRDLRVSPSTEPIKESLVGQSILSGQRGDMVLEEFEFDAITDIELTSGPASLVDVCFTPVWQDSRFDWKPIEGFEYPMRLPVTQPEYPCTLGEQEKLELARALARTRIRYGDPDRFTLRQSSSAGDGSVAVSNGSMIVTGTGTNWSYSLVGKILEVNGDTTGYTIINVLKANELILSRTYTGPSRNAGYNISQDSFAQLCDYLIQLVSGGPSFAPMFDRYSPPPVYSKGNINLTNGSRDVTGIQDLSGNLPNWNSELDDLNLRVIIDRRGVVTVNDGDRAVFGDGTFWDSRLNNMIIEIKSDRKTYRILRVDSTTRLTLYNDYRGEFAFRRSYTIREGRDYGIMNISSPTSLILKQAFTGSSASSLSYEILADFISEQRIRFNPTMSRQYIIDLILLGALNAAIAQMLGLYWIDDTVELNAPYDYLIVANDSGPLLNEYGMLKRIFRDGFVGLDAYIVFNKRKTSSPPLEPPTDAKCFVLPSMGTNLQNCSIQDRSDIVGLTWDLGKSSLGVLAPSKPIMYHLWRADLGINEPSTSPPDEMLEPVTRERPILVANVTPDPTITQERPRNWPEFRLNTFDSNVHDGWYSYKLSGIDIFGRHSSNSLSAPWYQWGRPSSAAPEPLPYYYQLPPEDTQIHPFAVRLLDLEPPPPPSAVEAYALDPEDPTVLKDIPFTLWRDSLTSSDWYQNLNDDDRRNLIGLRVSWIWTYDQMRQAPDTREFRIYYQAGQLNSKVRGQMSDVSITRINDRMEADIETNIINRLPVDAYKGCWLQTGSNKFLIIGNAAESPLRLRVRLPNLIRNNGTVNIKHNSPIVEGRGTDWDENIMGLTFNVQGDDSKYLILNIKQVEFPPPDFKIWLDRNFDGPDGDDKAYSISGKLPRANTPCAIFIPPPPVLKSGRISATSGSQNLIGQTTTWDTSLVDSAIKIEQEQSTYIIELVSSETSLTLDRPYDGSSGDDKVFTINPLYIDHSSATNWDERYHVVDYNQNFKESFEDAYDITGKTLAGSQADMVTGFFASIHLDGNPDLSYVKSDFDQLFLENDRNLPRKFYCISAVDNDTKTVTLYEAPDLGNAPSPWIIGWPYRKYEIFLPEPSGPYHQGIPLITSVEEPIVYADIGVSAADNKIYTLDNGKWDSGRWGGRYGNEGAVSAPATIFRVRRLAPDRPIPPPDSEKIYASPADYHSHSFYTYRWVPVASLKTHIFRALDHAIFKTDWSNHLSSPPRPPLTSARLEFFPSEADDPRWNSSKREQVVEELNFLDSFPHNEDGMMQAMAYYEGLSNDALRVLAGLSGNEQAFSQLTIIPLDPDDPANSDRLGPDNPPPDQVRDDLRAYIDTLDGRSTNRYFYRSAYVDGANNQSRLSITSPPIWLHDVIPPRAPAITKILGGDGEIIINWASNREEDLVEYRIYRTDLKDSIRDVRLMTLVNTIDVPPGNSADRPIEVTWTDSSVIGLVDYYYMIVAVDNFGNISNPSLPASMRAFDEAFPLVPALNLRWSEAEPVIVRVSWTADVQTLLERRPADGRIWNNVTKWLNPGTYLISDPMDPALSWSYRLRARKKTGALALGPVANIVAMGDLNG